LVPQIDNKPRHLCRGLFFYGSEYLFQMLLSIECWNDADSTVAAISATYVMLDLETMEAEKFEISKSIEKDVPDPVEDEYSQPAY